MIFQSIHLRNDLFLQDAKIKRLEQGSISSQSSLPSRSTPVRRTNINHPLATQSKPMPSTRPPLPPSVSVSQQLKTNPRLV